MPQVNSADTCKLLILVNGCPPFALSLLHEAFENLVGGDTNDFARYAIANDVVVLKPCVGGFIDTKRFPP